MKKKDLTIIEESMRTAEWVDIDLIKPYENNPRINKKAIDKVKQSILRFGFNVPLTVDKNGVIATGHTRYQAAKELGLKKVLTIYLNDLTEEQIQAWRLVDNRTNEYAEWDFDKLNVELKTLNGKGFDLSEFDFELEEEPVGDLDDNFEPVLPDEPVSKPGDIFELGDHRLMCGDATKKEDVDRLLRGGLIDMVLTDPPYNVAYDANGTRSDKIANDSFKTDEECGEHLWLPAFKNYKSIAKDCCSYVCFMPQGGTHMMMMMMWYKAGWQVKHEFIWKKQSIVLNRADVNYQHEPMVVGWNKSHKFYGKGKFHNTSVWEFNRPTKSKEHPTMKPLDLLGEALLNYTKKGDSVCDLFSGSGSTLMACEKLGRICYAMELEPKYVDVIINRWEKETGKKAVKVNA